MVKKENRGRNMIEAASENKRRVAEYFERNPEALQRECAEDLGMCARTVRKHIRAINAEKSQTQGA